MALAIAAIAIGAIIGTPWPSIGFEIPDIARVLAPQFRPGTAPKGPSAASAKLPRAQSVAKVASARGSLGDGLQAIAKKDAKRARAIRLGMAANSLDRKVLSWSLALSGLDDIPAGEIADIINALADWPSRTYMIRNWERALLREGNFSAALAAFRGRAPQTTSGALVLAQAYLQSGNRRQANATIAPFWRTERLDRAVEKIVLARVGSALDRADHKARMHMLFYNDRAKDANRLAGVAQASSLAKARTAVVRRKANAGQLLAAVDAVHRGDPGYLFAKIQYLRRTGEYRKAAQLLASAPSDPRLLIDADEWWVERRLVSRGLIDLGEARTAYRVAAGHSAQSRAKRAEAEFHAGWFALRFVGDKATAKRHFANILEISSTPISQARGHYWSARASSGAKATAHYRRAAAHAGTFYGQLAAAKLGQKSLAIKRARPTPGDRIAFRSRELVSAIKRLEEVEFAWRAKPVYRYLAKELQSPGEIAILAARAEGRGEHSLGLQIGKIAYARGLPVTSVAWPLGAIPSSAKVNDVGKAMAYAVARQESAFNVAAVSSASARGLLQLLPATAKRMAKAVNVTYSKNRLTRDPSYNVLLGTEYLARQRARFGGSNILTFAGYNAGPGNVDKWLAKYGDPRRRPLAEVIDWIERIPFTETRNYVQRVMENYQVYKSRISNAPLTIVEDLRTGQRG